MIHLVCLHRYLSRESPQIQKALEPECLLYRFITFTNLPSKSLQWLQPFHSFFCRQQLCHGGLSRCL